MKVRALLAAWSMLVAAAVPGVAQEGTPAVAMGSDRMVRGTVSAVAGDHLTVKTEDGQVFQVVTSPNTQVRKGRDPARLADVHAGDGIGAMGEIDRPNKTVHALFLMVVDAEQIRKLREAMGKTYIAGKVTAIDELKLTILRADGVSQTIAVDEDTSFRRGGRVNLGAAAGADPVRQPQPGGESITLADIKVGDSVGGPGGLKNGVFVPTQLVVGDPAAAGRRRGPRGAGSAPPAGEPR